MRAESLFSEHFKLNRRVIVAGSFAALAGALLAGCNYRTEEFRYRMTVEVETPQGLRTGSSVIEVEIYDPGPNSLPDAGINTKVRGEAVAVDLPGGKVLFALLRSRDGVDAASGYAYKALNPPRHRGDYGFIEQTRDLKRMRGLGTLPREAFPMFVTFDDLDDPKSVVQVDPDDLPAAFGEGISLRRITVQVTDEPVTREIDETLDKIGITNGDSLDRDFEPTTNPTLAQTLSYRDFVRGFSQLCIQPYSILCWL